MILFIILQISLFYKALAGSTNLIPPDNATEWEVYSPLSVWLQQKIEGATIRALNQWLDTKIKVKTARNLLNNAYLYQTTGAIEHTSNDKGYEVGIQIVGARSIGTKMRVSRVGVRFDTVQADLVINLFSAISTKRTQYRLQRFNIQRQEISNGFQSIGILMAKGRII